MTRSVPILLSVAAALLCLAGCDPAVKARYHPTSVDEVFGPFSQVWGIEAEIHELPASPPALEVGEIRKRPCRPPGLVMKPTDMVAMESRPSYRGSVDPTLMEGSYEPPLSSPPPGPAHRIASWNRAEEAGAKEPISTPPYSPKLEPGRSVYRGGVTLMGSYRTDTYSWCDPAANQRR